MVTKLVPRGYRLALEDLGARVLEVPPIEIPGREKPGDKYQYLYTKLNMFRLEGIYDKVLFFDVDLFFLRDSPIDLFDWIPENATYFFGSTSEWKKGYGAFNSGIQLFKPSHFHYSELIEKARDPNFAGYGDQSLHNHYWVKDGPFPWTELPQKYNTHHLYDRNTQEIADGIGFHGKLWSECHLLNNASAPLFQLFAETAQAIRNLQMRKYETGESDTETVIMPVVPSACLYWNSFTKRKGGMFMKLVIVSMDTTPKSILKTRQEFGEIFSQANHVVMKRDERGGGKVSLVLRQLRMVKELFERYDFVWMLDDAVSMKGMSNSTILYDLHDHTHLTTFADCVNQKGENATASFLISKMAENKLDRVLSQYAEDKNAAAVSELSSVGAFIQRIYAGWW
ncbi:nucleotide-diphospho-sugar transferase [Obelidium mucronatum]|nr:nucleotide-diphospho-sugar transferase [Obelidium mucronatum]